VALVFQYGWYGILEVFDVFEVVGMGTMLRKCGLGGKDNCEYTE
jgi:hypothetical protein